MEMTMNRIPGALLAVISMGALGASTQALADNPLGAYVGVGAGVSNVGNNNYAYDYGYYGSFRDNLAWKAMVGIRPLPIVGAELEYIDFGSNDGHDGYYGPNYYYGPNSHPKAAVLYGLGYLPLPVPFLDVYGKLGVARLQTDVTSFSGCAGYYAPGSTGGCTPTGFRFDQWDDKFAYGAGVQTKFQDFAFRAEYERISSIYGNPAAFTVSATWSF
jgi:Outer membrane protein beta-barrel domain